MARKTIAEVEAENEALKAQLAESADTEALVAENKALVESAELNKQAKEQAEARLLQAIEDMEKPEVVNGQVQAVGCKIFYGNEYTEDLMNRGKEIVSKFNIEILRAFINSDWSPSMIMEKFGITQRQLQSYVWKLSEEELRGEKPIKLDFKRDVFGREG